MQGRVYKVSGKSSGLPSKSKGVRGPLAGRRPGVGAPPVRRGRWHARRREVVCGPPGRDGQKRPAQICDAKNDQGQKLGATGFKKIETLGREQACMRASAGLVVCNAHLHRFKASSPELHLQSAIAAQDSEVI